MVTIALLVLFIILFGESMTTGAIVGLVIGVLLATAIMAYHVRLQNKNLNS